jgi:shikimate kinase
MGAGKTTVGRLLADRLGCIYYDNDEQLKQLSGRSALDLELSAGVEDLHRRELDELRRLAQLPPPFVGGVAASIADSEPGLALVRSTGYTVYLAAPAQVLAARTGLHSGRPLLGARPAAVLEEQVARRDPAYRAAAHLTIETATLAPAATVDRIADALQNFAP